jgi:hypothetical protein
MDCTDGAPGTDLVSTIGFYVVALAVLATIYGIRKRWAVREAAGFVKVAFWWEAIVHALAVSAVIVFALLFALGYLFRNGM